MLRKAHCQPLQLLRASSLTAVYPDQLAVYGFFHLNNCINGADLCLTRIDSYSVKALCNHLFCLITLFSQNLK